MLLSMSYVGSGRSVFGVVMAEKRAQAETIVIYGGQLSEGAMKDINLFTAILGEQGFLRQLSAFFVCSTTNGLQAPLRLSTRTAAIG